MFWWWPDWNYNNYVTLCIDCCISTQRAGARDGYSFFAVDSLRTTVSAPLWLKEIQRFLSIYGSVQKCSDELPHPYWMVQMDYNCQEQRQFHLDVASGTMLLACWSFIMRNIMAEYFLLSHSVYMYVVMTKNFRWGLTNRKKCIGLWSSCQLLLILRICGGWWGVALSSANCWRCGHLYCTLPLS